MTISASLEALFDPGDRVFSEPLLLVTLKLLLVLLLLPLGSNTNHEVSVI